jgi:hypothetical protein
MSDKQEWYYARGGSQVGPVTFAQLTDVAKTGSLGRDDLVWREGMGDWQPASTIPGLIPAPAAPAPAAAQPDVYDTAPEPAFQPPRPQPYYAPPMGPVHMQYAQPGMQAKSYKGLAIGGFVCSLVGLLCCILVAITGLVLGIVAKVNMNKSGNQDGSGFATAAIIIGGCGVLLQIVLIIVQVALDASR